MKRDDQQKVGAIIAAGGSSRRMGGIDKMFAPMGGKPVLARVISVFQGCASIEQIVVVLSERSLKQGQQLVAEQGWAKASVCRGGERRQDSVLNGLSQLTHCGWVVIHDGARPLVTIGLIEEGLESVKETGAAIAAVPATDTIKIVDKEMIARQTLPRDSLWLCQTPQVFLYDLLTKAYRKATAEVTDDAQIVELAGGKVKLYMGSHDNIKITAPADLAMAEMLWKRRKV